MIKIPHSAPFVNSKVMPDIIDTINRGFIGFDVNLNKRICDNISQYFYLTNLVVTPSASIALFLALKKIGISVGDEVVLSAINCPSVVNTIKMLGATPVFCDVRSRVDFRSDLQTIEHKITPCTKCVIITHMFGALVEDVLIESLKKQYPNIKVLEDFSTSFGSTLEKKARWSDYAIISFGSTKPITGGIGGVLLMRNSGYVEDYDEVEAQDLMFNVKVSKVDQLVLMYNLVNYQKTFQKRQAMLDWLERFVPIYQASEYVMFRAITFLSIETLNNEVMKLGGELDFRTNAQPNLARLFDLKELKNAMEFAPYFSIPMNASLYEFLVQVGEIKGLNP